VDRVHESVDCTGSVHHGPAAIAALGSSPELGLQPLRCPRAPTEGAGEREGGPANSMAGLPRLRRRWKSVSPETETLARKDDGEGAVRARREGVGGVGGFTEGGVGFYRAEMRPSVFNGRR
jgi:hypothetical protein